jgi:hypothetical protein
MELYFPAQTVTWTARILAYRRLEILQDLLRMYPHLTASRLRPFYEKFIVQPIALCEPETTD